MSDDALEQRLTELRAKHGRIAHFTTPDGVTIVVRPASLKEWEDFSEDMNSDKRKGPTRRELVQVCTLEPDLNALKQQFDRYPMLPQRLSEAVGDMAGLDFEVTVKKG